MNKKQRLDQNAAKRINDSKVATVVGGLVIFAALIGLFFFVYHRRASNPDYEGTIVDRWTEGADSRGAPPSLRLLVESEDHKRFTVKVEPHVYESARVGMRIKSRDGQVVLIEPNSNSMSGK